MNESERKNNMLEITSLIENVSEAKDLSKEHGLSLYIRYQDKKYLFDTGAGSDFIKNAERMNIDLTSLDGVMISHNHNDHTGGLAALLSYNRDAKVYIKSDARGEGAWYKKFFVQKYIGIDRSLFEKYPDRFIFVDDEYEVSEGFHLLSDKRDDSYYFCKDKSLFEKRDGMYIPDTFGHEMFAVIETDEGLTVISSCSHNGIVNIIHSVKAYSDRPISRIIGGFHLMGFGLNPLNCKPEYIREVAGILAENCDDKIYTCHCTGMKAYQIMRQAIGDKIEYFSTGMVIK